MNSTWLITSELANQRARKVLFTCVVYTNRAYLLRTEITKSHLNNRICQHYGVKTSTAIPSFYYVFNISLSCNNNMPNFIGNLWWVLLLRNHLNSPILFMKTKPSVVSRFLICYLIFKGKQKNSSLPKKPRKASNKAKTRDISKIYRMQI